MGFVIFYGWVRVKVKVGVEVRPSGHPLGNYGLELNFTCGGVKS